MGTIRGRFYFKKTSNGNLFGEFSNQGDSINTESADLESIEEYKDINKYEGTYHSTWQESKTPVFAMLNIDRFGIFYDLKWEVKKSKTVFKGKAMLCDGMLVGDYEEV